jgi:hypothetical protein
MFSQLARCTALGRLLPRHLWGWCGPSDLMRCCGTDSPAVIPNRSALGGWELVPHHERQKRLGADSEAAGWRQAPQETSSKTVAAAAIPSQPGRAHSK